MNNHIRIKTTTYQGYEDDVLEILNLNRSSSETKEYLNWRYLGEQSDLTPIVFWVFDSRDKRVGMSSLIFRAYWINGKKHYVGVRGDTSLNIELRGKGIGKKLLFEMFEYLEQSEINYVFSLANTNSLRASQAAGWAIDDAFVPFVMAVNPTKKIEEKLRIKLISKILGNSFYILFRLRLFFCKSNKINLVFANHFDSSFDEFWNKRPKHIGFIRDKSTHVLEWRYCQHPKKTFEICKVISGDEMVGYIVFNMEHTGELAICSLYELIVTDVRLIGSIVNKLCSVLIKRYSNKLSSIRIHLNEKCVLSRPLRKTGFSKREKSGVIVSYKKPAIKEFNPEMYLFTLGDKDI